MGSHRPLMRAMVLALMSVLIASCGVPQEEHDRALEEVANLTALNERLEADVERLSETDSAYYQRAQDMMKSNDWAAAESTLDELLRRWPGSSVEDAAKELRGYTRENQAAQKYKEAELLIESGKNPQGAKTRLQGILANFGDTSVVSKARSDLRNLDPLIAAADEKRARDARARAQQRARDQASLELTAFNWRHEYGYAIVEGRVKNISGKSLDSVEAVATCYDSSDGFISSSTALVEYRPILANQTSPLTVMVSWNPAMKKCGLEFKEFFGGALPAYHSWNK